MDLKHPNILKRDIKRKERMIINYLIIIQEKMRKYLNIIGFVFLLIAIPLLIDICIFGNTFPSNINNQAWA